MMQDYFKKLPRYLNDLILSAGRVARENGLVAYLVGGCVRDMILGVENLDLDIVIEGDGIKFAEALAGRLEAKLTRHSRFGTATIKCKEGFKVDIATARRESYPVAASLPQVEPGNLKNDLARRDFTINAMAIDITGKNPGYIIDLFGGKDDLRNKKIRVLHDLSFIDDPTRMLRAIRFEQRYGFTIEPHTLGLLKEAVRIKMLEKVSLHRTRDELVLILKEGRPLRYIRRMQKLIGLKFIDNRLSLTKKTYVLLEAIEKQIAWFKRAHPQRRKIEDWLMYFAGLLDTLKIKDTESICEKLALRNGDKKRMLSYKKINKKFINQLSRKNVRPARIFHILEPLSYEVILLSRAKYKIKNFSKHTEDFFKVYNDIRLCISGEDLRKLGLSPGPLYQKIFSRVLNAKLDGVIKNRYEELRLIKEIIAGI